MTESQWTSELTNYLKNAGCIVFKHSDHFTTGVPDLSCTCRGNTTWFEVKVLKKEEFFTERIFIKKDSTQFFMMAALATLGRAYYVIRWNDVLWVISPDFLASLKGTPKELAQAKILQSAPLCTSTYTSVPFATAASNFSLVLELARHQR